VRYFPLIVAAWLLVWLLPSSAWAQKLECKPCSHSFGNVQVGASDSFSIELLNTGTKGLTIQSASKQGPLAFSLDNLSLPLSIKSGERVHLTIVFAPNEPGQKTGVFALVNTAENRSLKIDVSGVAEANTKANGQLKVSPANLNFGSVAVGSSASRQATLSASKDSVTISSDRSTSSEFEILGLKLPVTIPAGHSIPVTIQFTPNGSGTDPAKVGFISNAADSPTLEAVTGTGVAKGSYSVSLSWDGVATAVGYNVFRGTAKSGPFHEINTALDSSTDYTDSTVVAGATYYYVTTAVNAKGEQSGYSNVTEAVIPD
jgi:ASPM-SPD-2-Hydin domain-containing protein